ncbi:MAG: zinc-binding alcohol dehydrogenase family protein [Bacteroidales bacterium]|nr:zinc-binding alcohol dehydrogenase family protein [Bacteroidales bacterium]
MKAINIKGERQIGLVVMDEPVPGADEVLVRLEYVGFCGSDLNTYLGRNPMVKLPVIPGHEIGAVVEKVGEAVPEIIRPGMTVTVNPYTNCGKCPSCRNGRVNACQFNETLGVQRNGAMRERMVLPWTKIIPAEGLDVRTCALVEPMSVGFHAVERGAVSDIDTVMVIGCGMVGLGAVVRSALRGATVIAADIDDEKLALARQMGAAHTVNTMTEDVHARLQEITAGAGPDVIIEAVGNPHTYRMAVDEVAFTGRVVCIGYANSEVSFQTKYFVQKELDIRGSRNAMPSDFRAVIRYMQKGECPVDRLVSMVVSPQEAEDAMNRWAEAPGKIFRILVKF